MKFCALLLCVSVLLCDVTVDAATATVSVYGTKAIHVTSKRYLSYGMATNTVRIHWSTFDFKSVKLKTLAKALAPAYLRFSGTTADRLYFNTTFSGLGKPDFPAVNYSMSPADWDDINRWCLDVGWDLIFGLNQEIRKPDGNGTIWDPSNAIELLKYWVKQGYHKHLHFQLGNEPDRFIYHNLTVLTGREIARDYEILRDLLRVKFAPAFDQSLISGPDMSRTDLPVSKELFRDFLSNVSADVIQAVTFHHYYGGDTHKVASFIDPARFDSYYATVEDIQRIVAASPYPNLAIWNSEAGVSGGDTHTGLETKFEGSFQMVEHLGVSARMGLDVMTQQTFYSIWLGLIDINLDPNPPYWIALLFKQLVDREVLAVNISGLATNQNRLRLYAHCTSRSYVTANNLMSGAVTVYGMNLYDDDMVVNFGSPEVLLYLLTSDSLASPNTWINGAPVFIYRNDSLPVLEPIKVQGDDVIMPSQSLAFVVIPDAQALACM